VSSDSTPSPAHALLIDYGGVLTNPLYPLLEAFCRSYGLAPDAIVVAMGPGSELQGEFEAYELGQVSEAKFMPRFAAGLGITEAQLGTMLNGLEPDAAMFDAVAEIRRQGVPTCLVSNSWGVSVYPRDLIASVFDGVVISEEVGMRKPNPDIFEHAAATIGVAPEDCVFVDDTAGHLKGAAAVGMAVIHHTDPVDTLERLQAILGVDLSDTAYLGGR
jgi:putative hydrolase of the HAD superfamily